MQRIDLKMNSYATFDQLQNTPSREAGVSKGLEDQLRFMGCKQIKRAGKLLKLPIVTTCTGQTLFHRFYYVHSFTEHGLMKIAGACTFLACKLTEKHRRARDIVNVYDYLNRSNEEWQPIDLYTDVSSVLLRKGLFSGQECFITSGITRIEEFSFSG